MTRVHSASPVFGQDLFGLDFLFAEEVIEVMHLFLLENTMIM